MPEILDIPEMVFPSIESTVVFVAVIAFVAVAFVVGVWCGGNPTKTNTCSKRWGLVAAFGMVIWLTIGALIPFSDVLETKMLPPPPIFLIGISFMLAVGLSFSPVGKRIAYLPFPALIGFHAFRLPLELVLHNWYESGTLPVQMTYSGHNFDIATGILAIAIAIWALVGTIPRTAIWFFNVVGTVLLGVVIFIALTSSPLSIRQYLDDPPLLLVYHFPYSWIVTIAVTGALCAHLILFRKLLERLGPR